MTLATVSGSTPETESFLSATSVHGRCGYFFDGRLRDNDKIFQKKTSKCFQS